MNILITGGGGFIGRNTAFALQSAGYNVTVTDFLDCSSFFTNRQINFIRGDICDVKFLNTLFEMNDFELVFHMAGLLVPEQALKDVITGLDINISATIKLLHIMKQNSVRKIIFLSSGGTVYGNNKKEINSESDPTIPINNYGWMKLSTEEYIRMFSFQENIEYMIYRVSNPYGRWQNNYGRQGFIAVSIGNIIKGNPLVVFGDGSAIRDYIYINDLIDIFIHLIKKETWNKTINIGSGVGTSLNHIIGVLDNVILSDFTVSYIRERTVDIPKNILNIDILNSLIGPYEFTSLNKGIGETWNYAKNDKM